MPAMTTKQLTVDLMLITRVFKKILVVGHMSMPVRVPSTKLVMVVANTSLLGLLSTWLELVDLVLPHMIRMRVLALLLLDTSARLKVGKL